MKKNIKIILLIIMLLLVTNAVTYKLTYQHIEFKSFLLNAKIDALRLKAQDQNNTSLAMLNIDSLFYAVNETDDLEKYMPICKAFDEKLFAIADKHHINKTQNHDLFQEQQQKIESGKQKIKRLCNVSK